MYRGRLKKPPKEMTVPITHEKPMEQKEEVKHVEEGSLWRRYKSVVYPEHAVTDEKQEELKGIKVVPEEQMEACRQTEKNFYSTYGEIYTEGVAKLMDLMNGRPISVIYDIGSGLGKCAFQLFFDHPHLTKVVAIEYVPARHMYATAGGERLAAAYPTSFQFSRQPDGKLAILSTTAKDKPRHLEFWNSSLFDCNLSAADFLIMDVALRPLKSEMAESTITRLLGTLSTLKSTATLLTYEPLHHLSVSFPLRYVQSVCLPTSWSPRGNGYSFYMYECPRYV